MSLKGTVLLLVALAGSLLLRRASASLRHQIWTLAFAGLLVLPALGAVLPEWRISLPGIAALGEWTAVPLLLRRQC